MLESEVEKPSVAHAKKYGIKVKKKVFGEQLDRWFFFDGGYIFIVEFKAPTKRLTDLQHEEIKELLALGFDVEVHDNVQEFKQAFTKRLCRKGRKVEPAPIPERFYPLALGARSGRSIRRSRNGKNFNNFRRFKGS